MIDKYQKGKLTNNFNIFFKNNFQQLKLDKLRTVFEMTCKCSGLINESILLRNVFTSVDCPAFLV